MFSVDDLIDYHPGYDIQSNVFDTWSDEITTQSNFENADHIQICLTNPSEPVGNNGWDNSNGDLICYKNMEIFDHEGHRFKLKDWIGHGQFGQVYECEIVNRNSYYFSAPKRTNARYAVKISKSHQNAINQFSYESQALFYVCIFIWLKKLIPKFNHFGIDFLDHFFLDFLTF